MPDKNGNKPEDEFIELENGLRLRVKTVPAFLVQRVLSQIKTPEPPIFVNPTTGHESHNTTDPRYLSELEQAELKRVSVSLFAAILYGTEMVDEDGNKIDAPPADEDDWEYKMNYVGVDWRESFREDFPVPPEADLTFARNACYVIYTQMSTNDIRNVSSRLLSGEAYKEAIDTFQGGTSRRSNRAVRPKRGQQT